MRHPDYPIWSFVGLCLVLLPAPWHFRARNVATICLIFWQALANLIIFINSLVWADNYANVSPVWCDISGRLMLAVGYAIPACSLCQMRRLESVASTRRSSVSQKDRSRRIWAELALCVLFPLLMLPIHYLVEGHRYDLLENVGPNISFYRSWPAILVRFIVPVLVSLMALVFAALAVRWFLVRRLQFKSILASSQTGFNIDRYLRLIALAVTDVSLLVIFDIVAIITTFHGSGDFNHAKIQSDIRWSSIHFNYNQISQIPEEINSSASHVAQVLYLYMTPLYSMVFFIFFGFGEEAIKEYVAGGRWARRIVRLDVRNAQTTSPNINLGSKVVPSIFTCEAKDIRSPVSPEAIERKAGHGGIPVVVERCVV